MEDKDKIDFGIKLKAKVENSVIEKFPNFQTVGINCPFTYKDNIRRILYTNTNYRGEYIFEAYIIVDGGSAFKLSIIEEGKWAAPRFTLQDLDKNSLITFYPEKDKPK